MVSDITYEYLSQWKWYPLFKRQPKQYYAHRFDYPTGKQVYLHRVIWEFHNGKIPPNMQIDHINHDTLDNQITNIRLVTCSQNHFNKRKNSNNTTGYKGVTYHKSRENYKARITFNYREIFLGRYISPMEAAIAYDIASLLLFKEYGFRNFDSLNISGLPTNKLTEIRDYVEKRVYEFQNKHIEEVS